MKRCFLLLPLLLFALSNLAQFEFENAPDYRPLYGRYYPAVKKEFNLSQGFDFELRLYVGTFVSNRLDILILSNKAGKWAARSFGGTLFNLDLKEQNLPPFNIDSLWEKLLQHNILSIPDSETIKDSSGNKIGTRVNDGTHYEFELLTPKKKRYFRYHSPHSYSKMLPYIKEYALVASMIDTIFSHCNLKREE